MAIDVKQFHTRLESERVRLEAELEESKASARPTEARREGSPFGKREEEATGSFELEKRLALERRIEEQIAEIDHALAKIKEGTYGLCDVCGQPIGLDRLEALPQANLCLSCKSKSKLRFPQK